MLKDKQLESRQDWSEQMWDIYPNQDQLIHRIPHSIQEPLWTWNVNRVAIDFYEMIVDWGFAFINYHLIEISSS